MALTELSQLQERYRDRGFTVLAFPTNDYHQELATNAEIQQFLAAQYPQVNFPVFGISSLRDNPVYQRLQQQIPNQHVQHNFFKYLVDRDGRATHLFTKKQDPLSLAPYIEALLGTAESAKS